MRGRVRYRRRGTATKRRIYYPLATAAGSVALPHPREWAFQELAGVPPVGALEDVAAQLAQAGVPDDPAPARTWTGAAAAPDDEEADA